MERIETLIQNLQHQLSNNASNAQLLTTAELLVVELRTPANTFIQKVSVQMPYVFVSDSEKLLVSMGSVSLVTNSFESNTFTLSLMVAFVILNSSAKYPTLHFSVEWK